MCLMCVPANIYSTNIVLTFLIAFGIPLHIAFPYVHTYNISLYISIFIYLFIYIYIYS